MSNVVSFSCTCEYLVKRAARHRRAGRYDEAMALLWKARNQFGPSDELLMEMAEVYEAIGCEAEASQAYLRLVRLGGKYKAQALFRLSVNAAQHGDLQRSISYYDHLRDLQSREDSLRGIASEMVEELGKQLQHESGHSRSLSAKRHARALERRSAALLQAGKAVAAERAMAHSLRLKPTARGYTMLSCCQLILGRMDNAVKSAEKAHEMAPGNVQALCVLADAYMAAGDTDRMRRTIYLAALRARRVDDLLSAAVESAKAGEDALTIRLTGRVLKLEPFHTRAMMMRACAHINCSRFEEAKRLLGRLCGLLPEDSVSESYYRALSAGQTKFEHLSLGLDVTREEGINRASELLAALYDDPKLIDEDPARCSRICRLCAWALRSPLAGSQVKTMAMVLMASLQSEEPNAVLLDLLMDPQIADTMKLHTLQILTGKNGFQPYHVDMGGKLVRLAAGGVSAKPVSSGQANSKIVQRVADRLSGEDPAAAKVLLNAYLSYLDAYGQPDSRHENACAAALDAWYHIHKGKKPKEESIARMYGVSVRMMRAYLRRFESCMQKQEQQGE